MNEENTVLDNTTPDNTDNQVADNPIPNPPVKSEKKARKKSRKKKIPQTDINLNIDDSLYDSYKCGSCGYSAKAEFNPCPQCGATLNWS